MQPVHSTAIKTVTHAPHLTKQGQGKRPELPKKRIVFQQPSIMDKGTHLVRALASWGRAGMPLAAEALKTQRLAICAACELWDKEGNWGFGQCKAPGCGCTKFKAWLLTEKCPHPNGSKWPDPASVDSPAKGE